jgi:PEP-CTERM motif
MTKWFSGDVTRKQIAIATLVLTLLWAGSAAAATIQFDTNGPAAGGVISITAFDPVPANAIAIGAASGTPVGTSFDLRYQGNLGVTTLNGLPNYLNGSNGNFYTFVAGFGETVLTNNGAGLLTFGFDAADPVNFFRMYRNTVGFGSDLAGTGFTAGSAILVGHIIATDFTSGFNAAVASPAQALDQSGADNYPATDTVTGSGATSLIVVIDSFDPVFFPDLVIGANFLFANTSQVLPYFQTDPSACFSSDGIANCDTPGVASVGAINGISGPDTMFQADANIAIVTAVPEPMSLILLGIGLVGAAGFSRLRRIKL